jgi:hypothetical protein
LLLIEDAWGAAAMINRGAKTLALPGLISRSILVFFILKAIYLLLGIFWGSDAHWLDVFHRNDSSWYAMIAEHGYPVQAPQPGVESEFAFFPLYPLAVRLFMFLLGDFQQAAFAFSLLTGMGWIVLMFKLLRVYGWEDFEIYRLLSLFQLLPFHHFHHVYYTEQLFVVLFTWILLSLEEGHAIRLFFLSLLLALTRPTGLIYAATIPLLFLVNLNLHSIKSWLLRCLPLLGAPAGLFLWMLYLHLHCGDALAFSHAQSGWNRSYQWPWESLFNQHALSITMLSIHAILVLLFSIIAFRKAGPGMQLFQAINLLFPLSTGQVISYPRYASANLPLFFSVRKYLTGRYFPIILGVAAILHLFVYYTWVKNLPIWSY